MIVRVLAISRKAACSKWPEPQLLELFGERLRGLREKPARMSVTWSADVGIRASPTSSTSRALHVNLSESLRPFEKRR